MEKLKNLSSNRAITLIALIITIIVMLILVAVSVSVLVESDLIGAAEKAGNAYKTAQNNEETMSEITIGGVRYDNMDDYLNNRPWTPIRIRATVEYNEDPVTAGGNVSAIKEGAPIPTGFYYVGGTLNTGVVISDDPDDENKGDGHNVALEGNQFVWVPVQREQTIKITVKSEKEITGIRIADPLCNEITTDISNKILAPSGTYYEVEINPTINGWYEIIVQAGEEDEVQEETEVVHITSLYEQDSSEYILTMSQIKEQRSATKEEFAEMVSAAAQEGGMTEQAFLEGLFGEGATIDSAYILFLQMMEGEVENAYQEQSFDYTDATIATYVESVETYGGFYIARYEAGSDVPRESSSASLTTVYSKKNMYPYNYVTQTQTIELSQGMDTGKNSITSDLVNAAAWDRTLNWLIETKAVTEDEVATDSTSWGNYLNSSFKFTGKYTTNYSNWPDNEGTNMTKTTYESSNNYYLLGTGVSNYTRKNNIYDLAGNYWEWTTEALSSDGSVVDRGGSYLNGGDGIPPSNRYYNSAAYSDYDHSFRPVLYINQ